MSALRRVAQNPIAGAQALEAWERRRGAIARGSVPDDDEEDLAMAGGMLQAAALGVQLHYDD